MVLPAVVNQPGMSLESLVGAFVLSKATEGKSPRTVEFYSENLRRFVWFAEKANWPQGIREINQWHLRAFLGYVATQKKRWGINGNGAETSERRASPATVRHYYNVLRQFYSWLVQEGIVGENLLGHIHVAKPVPPVIIPYSVEDIRRMLAVCDYDYDHNARFLGSRNRALVLVLLDTGLRLSELMGLKMGDINPENGHIKVLGKGRRERVVRVGDAAHQAVTRYLENRPKNDKEELWLSEEGVPLIKTGLQSLIQRLKERAGVGGAGTIHRFRHTFALQFLRMDRNVFNLQYLLGHSDLDMVRRYTSTMGQEDALAAHEKSSPADRLAGNSPGS
ncbi:MAG: tyrosine-type recombinase/integrase [Chloroflexota bacterium]